MYAEKQLLKSQGTSGFVIPKKENDQQKGEDNMNIDIQYLLFLQEIRNATGGIFDEIFNMISKIAVDIMPILPF